VLATQPLLLVELMKYTPVISNCISVYYKCVTFLMPSLSPKILVPAQASI